MKKLLASVLVLSFTFGLASCSDTKKKSKKEKKKVETKVEETEEEEIEVTPTPKPTPKPTDIPVETSVVYLYEEGEEPIKVDWDNLTLNKEESFGVKRLTDDYIFTFVPGSNSGPVFPIEMSYSETYTYIYGSLTSIRYGLIDSTGTIVCDDVFTKCFTINNGNSYITCRKDIYGNEYCGLLLADGSKFIERPSNYFYFVYDSDFVYIFDNVSNTLVVLDSYCNIISEVPNNFRTYSDADNYNYCSEGFYYDTWDKDDGIYCYAIGEKVYLGTSDATRNFTGYYDDLVFYDEDTNSYCVYDPDNGIIVEKDKYSFIRSRSKYYICTLKDGGYDLVDTNGNVLESFDEKYNNLGIFGDYLFALDKNSNLYIYDILNKTGNEYKTTVTSLNNVYSGADCFVYKSDDGYECYDYEMNHIGSTSYNESKCIYDPDTENFYVKKNENTIISFPDKEVIDLGDNGFSSPSYIHDGYFMFIERDKTTIKTSLMNSDGEVICVYYTTYSALDD